MGVFLPAGALLVGVEYGGDVFIEKGVLVLARLVVPACVDEQDIFAVFTGAAFLSGPVEDQDGHRDGCGLKEVDRQADHRIEQVVFDQFPPDTPLRSAPEENAVGHHYGHPALFFDGGLNHVADEGVVTLGFRRNTPPEAVVDIRFGLFDAPFLQGKRGIGHDVVEFHQAVMLHECGGGEGVAPLDPGGVRLVQEHVHPAQGPGAAVHLHAVDGMVTVAHGPGGLDQKSS